MPIGIKATGALTVYGINQERLNKHSMFEKPHGIKDVRVPEPVVTLEPKETDKARDCWTVCFGVGGYDNGDIKVFDLRTKSLRWETICQNGVVNVQFDRKDIEMNKFLVTHLFHKGI
ncbi:putative WD domain-containing protein [Phytophthora cinnamomi]|uniref:putative WD domain-containing protein n=1 Tax=Phytophthora cinnamomi TaxID=4785 RepID=UPI003559A1B2|nr:putative WD domain-containing protein [Phytophthora cinnamomi]